MNKTNVLASLFFHGPPGLRANPIAPATHERRALKRTPSSHTPSRASPREHPSQVEHLAQREAPHVADA